MVPSDHHHAHGHSHGDSRGHHGHSHGAMLPHPAQVPPWSILRMPVLARLVAAAVVSAGLWTIVLIAMR